MILTILFAVTNLTDFPILEPEFKELELTFKELNAEDVAEKEEKKEEEKIEVKIEEEKKPVEEEKKVEEKEPVKEEKKVEEKIEEKEPVKEEKKEEKIEEEKKPEKVEEEQKQEKEEKKEEVQVTPPFNYEDLIPNQEKRNDLLAFLQKFPKDNYSIVEIDNFSLYLKKGENYQKPTDLNVYLERYVKKKKTVVQYGIENPGISLKLSRLVGPKGKLIVFESNPKKFRELYWTLVLNHIQNVEMYSTILGEKNKKLDALNLKKIYFMRIDAKGKEDVFLKDATKSIQRCKPVMILNLLGGISVDKADKYLKQELERRMQEIEEMGYTIQSINGHEYLALPKK